MQLPRLDSLRSRILAATTTIAIVAAGLVVGFAVPAALAASDITLTATPTPSVLDGSSTTVSLSAANSTSTNDYNLSFRYQLPTGVSYVGGSTAPTSAGEPTVNTVTYTPNPQQPGVTATYQVLVWSNVSDLPVGAQYGITFSVSPNSTTYPVGSTYQAQAGAYANSNARSVPTFDSNGNAVAGSYTTSATTTTTTTTLSALSVTKTQNMPENEVMRGVHGGHGAIYTINVTEASTAASSGVTVTDYLPAGLEFLGCGGTAVDNSSAQEYPGSGPLDGISVPANCSTPASITTVQNPTGYPAGVYTEVVWNVGTLAAGATTTIEYAAGIPLRENTMTFPNGTPSPASDQQGSNLDNNTGPLTRQVNNGNVYTNTAVAAGTYAGPVAAGTSSSVSAQGSVNTEADDLSLVKTASSGSFTSGATVGIDLNLRASEYTSDSGITVTDTVPNGMCPLLPAGTQVTGGSLPSDCSATGTINGGTLQSVTANQDGSYTLVFTPNTQPLQESGSTDITYSVVQRSDYNSNGNPVASGDTFTAPATVSGTSTVLPATGQTPTTEPVTDDSQVTFTTAPPTISKLILPRTSGITSASSCANSAYANQYVQNDTATSGFPVFQMGDRICFELNVNFSTTTQTKDALITDLVPVGTTYDSYYVPSSSGVPASQVSAPNTSTANAPQWSIGQQGSGGGSDLYVAQGAQLTMFVTAIVSNPATGTTPQLTGNLMKYQQSNTAGNVSSLRDQANYSRAPAPTLALAKTISSIAGANQPAGTHTANVAETNVVNFGLTISNTGTAAIGNNFPVDSETVWDALPAGIVCASVSNIGSGGTCTDNYSGFSGANAGQSALVWNLTTTISPGASAPALTYSVTIPTGTSVSTVFANTGSITQFTSPNTAGGDTSYYPAASLDSSKASLANTSTANDTDTLTVPNASVTKTATTSVIGTNNSASQAVSGENATYAYTMTLPAGSTVYNGVLSDPLPSGVTTGPNTTVTADINGTTGYTPSTVPSGYTLSSSGTLSFPPTVDNTTTSPETFTVHLTNVVISRGEGSWTTTQSGRPTAATITNTASFASNATLSGSALPARTGSANVAFIVPAPTLSKAVSPTGAVTAGQTLTYTLTPAEGSTLPPLFDSTMTDCLPAGLTFQAYGSAPSGVTTTAAAPGSGSPCASGTTQLGWTYGTVTPGASASSSLVTFTATVNPQAAGSATYQNTATLTGSTLSDGANNPSDEAVYTATSNTTTSMVSGATIQKSVQNPTATVGGTDQYTITATMPAGVNFYGSAITDVIPSGLIASASGATVTCTNQTTSASCLSDLPSGGSPMTPSGQTIGWYLGDVTSASYVRVVTITYTATVDASSASQTINKAGAVLTNTGNIGWYVNQGSTPANAGSTFDKTGTPSPNATSNKASITVTEPSLSVTKSVTNPTPQPGDTFGYTVAVTNSNASTASAAYNVTVSDPIPSGIIATLPTTAPTGVTNESISGADPVHGGGTITWTIAGPVGVGQTINLTYSGTLAASSTLTAAPLKNTATITAWSSLPANGRNYPTGTAPSASATVTPRFPFINLAKTTPGGQIAYANTPFQWSFTATNTGLGTATTVTPTDTLPANWTYQTGSATVQIGSAAATQIDPATSTANGVETLVWSNLGPVAPGSVMTVTYNATPTTAALTNPGVGGSVPHTNTVAAATADPTGATANNTGSYTSSAASANAYIDSADVSIVKAAGGALVAGTSTPNAWTMTVSNANGGDTAVGPFTVSDTPSTLPAGVTITGASGSGWSCTTPDSNGNFTCARANANDTLASGSSFPVINVAASVASTVASGATATNSASVSDRTYDPTPGNNTSSAQATVTASADLQIVKTVSGSVHAGDPVTWNLAVSNLGPSVSRGPITVSDTLPSSVTGVTASGSGWTCTVSTGSPVNVSCTTGDLAVQSAPLITVSGMLASSSTGTLSNTAAVTPTTSDPNSGNNTSTASNPINTATTLLINKALVANTTPQPGATAQYQITVTNSGPSDAQTVSVTDPLPAGLTFVTGSTVSSTGNWTCSAAGSTPNTVTCDLSGSLSAASGSNTAVVQFSANVPSSDTGSITNTATAHAANASDVSSTNVSTDDVESDLAITKTHPSGPVTAGTSVVYTLGVTNNGPSDATGTTTVTDALPNAMTATAATGSGWTCSGTTTVTCTTTATIVDGAAAQPISITALVAPDVAPTTLVNTATVQGANNDPKLTNNTADDPTVIQTASTLHITKAVTTGSTVTAGDQVGYDVTVVNDGPSNAQGVTVADQLPTGMTPVSISGQGFTCTLSTFTCTDASMAPGTQVIHVVAATMSSVPDGSTLTNTANLSWTDSAGSHTGQATADVQVQAIANLALVKTPAQTTVAAGSGTSFSFGVTNHGTSDAAGPITIVDSMPVGMTYVGYTGGSWQCTPGSVTSTGQDVTCVTGSGTGVAAGGTGPALSIQVQLDPTLPTGPVTNTATVSSPTTEAQGADNSAQATIQVNPVDDLSIVKSHSGMVRIGSPLAFTLAVSNAGPSVAQGVQAVDQLPVGLSYLDSTGSDPAWTCVAGTPTSSGTTVTCDLTGTVGVAAAAPALIVNTTVQASAYPGVTNTATVTSTTPDSNTANNAASDPVVVPAQVALTVTKTHTGTLTVGQNATYTIAVANSGATPLPAGYAIVDQLPSGLTYTSASGQGVTCSDSGQTVTCLAGTALPVGGTQTVQLVAMVGSGAYPSVTNTADVDTTVQNTGTGPTNASDPAAVAAAPTSPSGSGSPLAHTGLDLPWQALLMLAVLGILAGLGLSLLRRRFGIDEV